MNDGIEFSQIGITKILKCGICSAKMKITHGYYGPTSWAGAMAKIYHQCNQHKCPNLEAEWHKKAVRINHEINQTVSPSLKKLLFKDMKAIVRKRMLHS